MADRLRIAVLDDDRAELDRIRRELEALGETGAEVFSDAEALLRAAGEKPPFDLAFLDIYLPDGTGIQVSEALRRISPDTDLVFITTSRDHAVDAFRLRALHYLVKPVSREDLAEALRRREAAGNAPRPSLTLSVNRESHRVYLDQIVHIQSVRHAVEVTLTDGRCLRVWTPRSELERMVDGNFLKINRGTIINMNEVSHMDIDTCFMSDGSCLSVTKKDRTELRERYNEFLINELHVMAAARRGDKK